MSRKALMVAFHFPPVVGSSGLQRTLKFATYLRDYEWHPTVLTLTPFAYRQVRDDQLGEIPRDVSVVRALAFDASRHFSIAGKHPAFLAVPDAWASWYWSAVPLGLAHILARRIDLIWSTYPFPSAHRIAASLARLSGRPWVADMRDMMVEDEYPEDLRLRERYRMIETRAVQAASRVVVTSPGTLASYRSRYPQQPDEKWSLIRNGYDERNFAGAEAHSIRRDDGELLLLHSGILYPSERDPEPFFQAIARLRDDGEIQAGSLRVRLRATGHDAHHRALLDRYELESIVELAPGVAYSEALAEMMVADGLLLFQASNCNHQTPAKAYEYLRTGRPVLTLTDPEGDTAALIRESGVGWVAPLDDTDAIRDTLRRFLSGLNDGTLRGAPLDVAKRYSRREQTGELARLFDAVLHEAG